VPGIAGRMAHRAAPAPAASATPRGRPAAGPLAERRVVIWALAASAGFVVSVCYRLLGRVEVGPMTGNTVVLGIGFGARGVGVQVARAVALAAFVGGVAAGVCTAELTARRGSPRALAVTVGVEVALLCVFVFWGVSLWGGHGLRPRSEAELDGLVALAAWAMGMQAAAVRRVHGQTVRTVYISGVLTRPPRRPSPGLVAPRPAHGAAEPPWRHEPTFYRAGLLAGIYAACWAPRCSARSCSTGSTSGPWPSRWGS